MLRRLFTATSVLSLLLCIATAVLWAQSYSRSDRILFEVSGTRGEFTASRGWFVNSCRGRIDLATSRYSPGDADQPFVVTSRRFSTETTEAREMIDTEAPSERWRFQRYSNWAGFGSWQILHSDETTRGIAFPHGFIVALFIVLPLQTAIRRYRASSRLRRGLCACGYDLRASRERCPECGTPITPNAKAKA